MPARRRSGPGARTSGAGERGVDEEPEVVGRRGEQATGRRLGRARRNGLSAPRRGCDRALVRVICAQAAQRSSRSCRAAKHRVAKYRSTAAGQALDDLLEVREALARITPPCPRRPSQVQRPVSLQLGKPVVWLSTMCAVIAAARSSPARYASATYIANGRSRSSARVDQGHHARGEDRLVRDAAANTVPSSTGPRPSPRLPAVTTLSPAVDHPDGGARGPVLIEQFGDHRHQIHGPIFHQRGAGDWGGRPQRGSWVGRLMEQFDQQIDGYRSHPTHERARTQRWRLYTQAAQT